MKVCGPFLLASPCQEEGADGRAAPLYVSGSYSGSNECRIDPLDFAKESVGLLDLIDRLTLGQPILQPPAQGSAGYGGRQPGAAPGKAP